MIKVYLILAHKNPAQLRRLIEALDDGLSAFYIHVDQTSPLEDFHELLQYVPQIHLVKRVKTEWGRFGIVEATLYGLQEIYDSEMSFSHVFLISGQDYPIKSNAYLTKFCLNNIDRFFLEFHHLPAHEKWQPHGGLYRVNKYFFGFTFWQRMSGKAINFFGRHISFFERKIYNRMEPYAGSMWWVLSKEAVCHIVNFIEQNPGYVDFHQYTFAPDEVFFQTILVNAKRLSGKMVNSNMRFIQWKDRFASHPELITTKHLQELLTSDALFARKFDAERGSAILDEIDQYRHSTQNHEAIF